MHTSSHALRSGNSEVHRSLQNCAFSVPKVLLSPVWSLESGGEKFVCPWFYQYTLSLTTGVKSISDIPDEFDNQRNFADNSVKQQHQIFIAQWILKTLVLESVNTEVREGKYVIQHITTSEDCTRSTMPPFDHRLTIFYLLMNYLSLDCPVLVAAITWCVYKHDNLFTFLKCTAVCLYINNRTKLKMMGAKKGLKKNLIYSDKPPENTLLAL
jgi:hypothetical protein